MFGQLPPHIVLHICCYIEDKHDLLSFTSACKQWRELVLCNSNIILKDKLSVKFMCKQADASKMLGEGEIEMFFKFINHTDTIVFEWSSCKTDNLLVIFESILQLSSLSVKSFYMKPRNEAMCKESCRKQTEKVDIWKQKVQLVAEHLSLLLKRCYNIEKLHLGFEPYLLKALFNQKHNANSGFIGAKLNTLNLAKGIPIKDNEESDNKQHCLNIVPMLNQCHLLLGIDERFFCTSHSNMFTHLIMDWDKDFFNLIEMLSDKRSGQTKLKHITSILHLHLYVEVINEKMWADFRQQCNIQIKLVVIEHKDMFHNQLIYVPASIPLHSVSILSPRVHINVPPLIFMPLESYCNTLSEIEFHYVEDERIDDVYDFSFLYCGFSEFSKLEKLVICGMFIEDRALLQIGTKFRKQLKELVVYQCDVLRESSVSGYLLPLNKSQVYGIEKTMTSTLGKDWYLVKNRHMNRSLSGCLQSKYQCILQDVI